MLMLNVQVGKSVIQSINVKANRAATMLIVVMTQLQRVS
jgi:hypothetical protein